MPTYKELRCSTQALAISLLVLPTTVGMYLNFFFKNLHWSNLIVIFSFVLLFLTCDLLRGKKLVGSKDLWLIVVFHLLCLVYLLISGKNAGKFLLFHFASIALPFLLMATWLDKKLMERIILFTWIISAVNALLAVYCFSKGYYLNLFDAEDPLIADKEDRILEAFTMSFGAIVNVAASLTLPLKGRFRTWFKYLPPIFIVLDFYVIILCEKRTPLFVITLMLVAFALKNRAKVFNVKSLLALLIFIVVLLVFVLSNQFIEERFNGIIDSFSNGVNDMIYGTQSDKYGSAVARFYARERAISMFNDNLTPFSLLFGNGYNFINQIDIQPLQLLIEMGTIGLVILIYFSILPFRVLYKTPSWNHCLLFACFVNFQPILCSLNSGSPYSFIRWFPLAIFLWFLKWRRRQLTTPDDAL